jgi:DnaJ-class molecular chaperone
VKKKATMLTSKKCPTCKGDAKKKRTCERCNQSGMILVEKHYNGKNSTTAY